MEIQCAESFLEFHDDTSTSCAILGARSWESWCSTNIYLFWLPRSCQVDHISSVSGNIVHIMDFWETLEFSEIFVYRVLVAQPKLINIFGLFPMSSFLYNHNLKNNNFTITDKKYLTGISHWIFRLLNGKNEWGCQTKTALGLRSWALFATKNAAASPTFVSKCITLQLLFSSASSAYFLLE